MWAAAEVIAAAHDGGIERQVMMSARGEWDVEPSGDAIPEWIGPLAEQTGRDDGDIQSSDGRHVCERVVRNVRT